MDIEITTTENNLLPSSFSTKVDVDEALEKSGFGRFQLSTEILFTFITIPTIYQCVLSYFIANDPPWKGIHNNTSKFCEQNFGIKIQPASKSSPAVVFYIGMNGHIQPVRNIQ